MVFLNKIHHNNCVTFVLKLKSSVGSSMLVEGKLPEKKKSKYTLAKKTCKIKQRKKSFDGYARNFKFWKWLNSTMSFHQSFWGVDLRNCGGYDFQKTRQKTIKE